MKNTAFGNRARGYIRQVLGTGAGLMLMLALPTALHAQFTYLTNGGTITITGYTGPDGPVTVPDSINGLPVVSIGDYAFVNSYGLHHLTSIVLPDTVESIGYCAFSWCGDLTNATLGYGLTTIGYGAFANCGLTTIVLPSAVITLGGSAFAYCGSLTGAYFQGDAPSGDSDVFTGDHNIVYYLPGTSGWGSTFCGRPTAPWGPQVLWICATNNGAITIIRYTGSGGAVIVPGTFNGLPVTSLADQAFWNCASVTSCIIPNGVTNIGASAFQGCTGLNSVSLPDSLTRLGQDAFAGCASLSSITIPGKVSLIDSWTFDHCSGLTNVTIANGVTTIQAWAFQYCVRLPSVALPGSVTSIIGMPFYSCTTLTTISVDPSNSVYSSRDGCLFNKSQTTLLQCPNGKAGSYTIPDTVTSIGYEGFYYCTNLSWVTFPGGLSSIGDEAFYWCTSLKGAFFKGNAPVVGSLVFTGDNNATVYYLAGTTGWSSPFAGLPAVLWNATIQTTNGSFGVQGNQFGFTITGTTNIPVVIEASIDLPTTNWTSLQTCTLTKGSLYFSDPMWTNYPERFYRTRWP